MKKTVYFLALFSFFFNANAQGTVTDIDGNTYDYLTYGTQQWTVENAAMETYRDGTPIPQVTDATQWSNLTTGAWCYYDNDPTKGKLYNWYAVAGIHDNDPNTPNREFAPEGWHVPSDCEWINIEIFLILNGYNYDGTITGNKIAKSMASTTGWLNSQIEGAAGNDQSLNNSSNFNAFPNSYRYDFGEFYGAPSSNASFWTSTEKNNQEAYNRYIDYNNFDLDGNDPTKGHGYYVRLVKNNIIPSSTEVCAGESSTLNVALTNASGTFAEGQLVNEFNHTINTNASQQFPTTVGLNYRLEIEGNVTWGTYCPALAYDPAYVLSGFYGTTEATPRDFACNDAMYSSIFCDSPGLRPIPDQYDGINHSYDYYFTANSNQISVGFFDNALGDNCGSVTFRLFENSTPPSQNSLVWSTGDTTETISVTPTETTEYWVDVTTNGVTCREYITIDVTAPAAPTGDAEQTFCDTATIADLTATGENIQWYDAATGGNLLDSTIALTDGQMVYASQTVNGCESTERLEVTVYIDFIDIFLGDDIVACTSESIILDAGAGFSEYLWSTGETTQTIEVTESGNYSVEVTNSNTAVTEIWINGVLEHTMEFDWIFNNTYSDYLYLGSAYSEPPNSPPPGQSYEQFIGSIDNVEIWNRKLSSLEINSFMNCPPIGNETGLLSYWNFENSDGLIFSDLSQNNNSGEFFNANIISNSYSDGYCIEDSNAVSFDHQTEGSYLKALNPVDNDTDFTVSMWINPSSLNSGFCHIYTGGYVGTAPEFSFYIGLHAIGEQPGEIRFTSQNDYRTYTYLDFDQWQYLTIARRRTPYTECSTSDSINVTFTAPAAPTGDAEQTFCDTATIADLTVTGDNIQWYDAATGGNLLISTTALTDGQTVHASQTVNGCESNDRLEVTVSIQDITITASASVVCAGESVDLSVVGDVNSTYLWSTGESNFSGQGTLVDEYSLTANIVSQNTFSIIPGNIYRLEVSGTISLGGGAGNQRDVAYYIQSGSDGTIEGTPFASACNVYLWTSLFCDTPGLRPTPDIYDASTHTYNYPFTANASTLVVGFWDSPLGDNGANVVTFKLYELSNSESTITVTPTDTTEYWVDITTNGVTCREYITITVNDVPAPPISGGDITSCETLNAQNLVATASVNTGESITWYDAITGGNVVADPSLSTPGTVTYFAEATNDTSGCVGQAKTAVTLTIEAAPDAPISGGDISECETIAAQSLVATALAEAGESITWYDAATGGNLVADPSLSTPGTVTYFAEATNDSSGCSSLSRTAVTLTITSVAAPTGEAVQSFCDNVTVSDLSANGTSLQWYDAPTAGNLLNSSYALSDGEMVYVSQTDNGCESVSRLEISVEIDVIPDPILLTTEIEFCIEAEVLLSDIEIDTQGFNLVWYDSYASGTVLPSDTLLEDQVSYFAALVDPSSSCESLNRLEYVPSIIPCEVFVYNALSLNDNGLNDHMVIEGSEYFPENTLQIFNRDGHLVYEKDQYGTGDNLFRGIANVNGIYRSGSKMPTGSYLYVFRYFNPYQQKEFIKKGFLMINSN
jgi:uncharacterized protein (TIGR02145 family)